MSCFGCGATYVQYRIAFLIVAESSFLLHLCPIVRPDSLLNASVYVKCHLADRSNHSFNENETPYQNARLVMFLMRSSASGLLIFGLRKYHIFNGTIRTVQRTSLEFLHSLIRRNIGFPITSNWLRHHAYLCILPAFGVHPPQWHLQLLRKILAQIRYLTYPSLKSSCLLHMLSSPPLALGLGHTS